ncbi:MAG: glycosyltransferase [Akkermansia sp.]|nr:glycosyltransferase [Akkermansia sp.]
MASETMIRFIYLGNLLIEKGPFVLLEACRILKERNVPFHCDLVGAPTAEITLHAVQALAQEYHLDGFVTIHGAQYGKAKEQLLKQADVMVFPTYYHNECFPLVLLEGMKQGLALISTKEGAIPDIIRDGETGLLIEKQNPESLAQAMEKLATAPDLASRLASAGRQLYEQCYSGVVFINRMLDILKNN